MHICKNPIHAESKSSNFEFMATCGRIIPTWILRRFCVIELRVECKNGIKANDELNYETLTWNEIGISRRFVSFCPRC